MFYKILQGFYTYFYSKKNTSRFKVGILFIMATGLFSCSDDSVAPPTPPDPPPPEGSGMFLYTGDDVKIGEILKGQEGSNSSFLWVKSLDGYLARAMAVSFSNYCYGVHGKAVVKFHLSQEKFTQGDPNIGLIPNTFTSEELAIIQPFLNFYDKPLFMTVVENTDDSKPRPPFFMLIDLRPSSIKTFPGGGFKIDIYDDIDEKYSARMYSKAEGTSYHQGYPIQYIDEKTFTAQFPIGWSKSKLFVIKDEYGTTIGNWPSS